MIRELVALRAAMRELAINPNVLIVLPSWQDADKILRSASIGLLARAVSDRLTADPRGGTIKLAGMTFWYPGIAE